MMNEHTAKAFDVDLQELTQRVAEMGGLAERLVADSGRNGVPQNALRREGGGMRHDRPGLAHRRAGSERAE